MLPLYFIGAIIWGSLTAQFLVQKITSLSISIIYLYGLLFSPVKREITAAGFAAALAQTLLFAALCVGGFIPNRNIRSSFGLDRQYGCRFRRIRYDIHLLLYPSAR